MLFKVKYRYTDMFLLAVITILLSTWGPVIIKIGNMYVPEIIMLPLLLFMFIENHSMIRILKDYALNHNMLLAQSYIILVTLLGILATGSIVGPYSELRASYILFFAFILFYKSHERDNICNVLLLLSFAVLCLDFLKAVLQVFVPDYSFLGHPITNEDELVSSTSRVSIPAIIILTATYLCIKQKKTVLLFIVLSIGSFLSLGGARIILLTTTICMFMLVVYCIDIWRKGPWKNKLIFSTLAIGFAGFITTMFLTGIVMNYLTSSKTLEYRLILKTIDTYENISTGFSNESTIDFGDEAIRVAYFSYLIGEWPRLLFPHGLGSREVYGKLGHGFDEYARQFGVPGDLLGNTHDVGILYMAYHHGILVTLIVASFFMYMIVWRWIKAANNYDQAYLMIALLGILFIDLTYPPVPGINVSFFYGSLIGLLLNANAA